MPPAASIQPELALLIPALVALATVAVAACPDGDAACTIQGVEGAGAADLFAQLSPATRRLTLRSLSLKDWPADAIRATGRAAQLESLELDGVTLLARPQQVVLGPPLTGLQTVRMLGGCPFSGLESLERLAKLDLIGCRIGAFNASWLRDLPALQRLNVDSAKVDSVHLAGLDRATRAALKDIRLTGNSFTTIEDDAFGSMPNLRNLTLDGNVIQYIKAGAFVQLPALQALSIVLPKEGQLAKIWEASLDGRFDNNTQLEILRLVNARLAEDQIPNSFEQLKRLRVLDLSGHRFRRLNNSVLSALTFLELLDLSNGSLACLYDRNFGVMGRLRRLNLANNDIRIIGQRALLGLHSLEAIDLSGNPIEAIEPGAFCTHRPAVRDSPRLLADWGLDAARVRGGANVSDACPADFDPNRLILSTRPQCLMPPRAPDGSGGGLDGGDGRKSPEQSRHTFLIIIGLCVAFLIVTVISMMAYKGWSKRKNAQLAKDEEKEQELQAMVAVAAAAEEGNGSGEAGAKKPQNGRQHHHRQHHHGQHQQPSPSGKSPAAGKVAAGAAAAAPSNGGGGGGGEIETTAQVESPNDRQVGEAEPTSTPGVVPDSQQQPPSAPQSLKPPQMRPGITQMITVPEDSDLEARAITTLVVV